MPRVDGVHGSQPDRSLGSGAIPARTRGTWSYGGEALFASEPEDALFDEMFPILSTADMPAALGFYRDLLGATVMYRFPADGEPDYVGLMLGSSHFGIGRQEQSGPTANGPTANDRVTLWVYTVDCDAAVAKLRSTGVPIIQEPADQPWGERMATVTDPDDNPVIVASRAA
jgi:lactoylglutathione lyase